MTIRSEVEAKLASFASSQIPPIPVAFENVAFSPPPGEWIEITFLNSNTVNRDVAAKGKTEHGSFQINVYTKLGIGTGRATELASEVASLFPVLPKEGSFSVESPPNTAKGFPEGDHWCVPTTVRYRAEF